MANRYLAMIAGLITEVQALVTSAGAGDAGKLVALDGAGKLDTSLMPTGVGADTQSIVSSENLAAGDLVNVFNSAGTPKVRKADASTSGKEANGFVLAVVVAPAAATVYFEGSNTQVTGLTGGKQYLDPANPGRTTHTAPTTAGQLVQPVGSATAAAVLNFESGTPVLLA
jgi:hypothetical protein